MADNENKVLSFGKKPKHEKDKTRNIEYCSFCKRSNLEVPKMVKGPNVNICSECTLIAVQYLILQDGVLSKEAQRILDLFWGAKN